MVEPSLSTIAEALGELKADMRNSREDIEHGAQSRERIHAKLDGHAHTLEMVGRSASTAAEVAIQTRNEFKKFEGEFIANSLPLIAAAAAFKSEAKPIIDALKIVLRIVTLLFGLGLLGVGGLIAFAAYAGETMKFAIRWYLGIP